MNTFTSPLFRPLLVALPTMFLPLALLSCSDGSGGGASAAASEAAESAASLLPARQMIPAGCSQVEVLISAPPQEDSTFNLQLSLEGAGPAVANQVAGKVNGILNARGDWMNWPFRGEWNQAIMASQGQNELGNIFFTAYGKGKLAHEPNIELSLSSLSIDIHQREDSSTPSGGDIILRGTVKSGKLSMDDAEQTSFSLSGAAVKLVYKR